MNELTNRATSSRSYVKFLAAVCLAGTAALVVLTPRGGWDLVAGNEAVFALFAAFVLIGELLPIKVPRHTSHDELTVSTGFSFATLLVFGVGPAIAVSALASVASDVSARVSPAKIVFNVAQYTLSLAAAAGVLAILADGALPVAVGADLAAVMAAAVAYFVVNNLLAGAGAALCRHFGVLAYLRGDLVFQLWTGGVLLALGPIIALAADTSLSLVPLFLFPILAIYVGGRAGVLNQHRASHDPLTDLPNRTLFEERLEYAIAQTQREGSRTVVMLLDLDDFKSVNDTLGHHHGDAVLKQVARRLRDALREDDTLARLGGDEFAIVLPSVTTLEDSVEVARRIQDALKQPLAVEEFSLEARASIGIACYPDHGGDAATIMKFADAALYAAKSTGKQWVVHEGAVTDPMFVDPLMQAGRIRKAIESGEIVLHYQPKYALRSGRLEGVEALVRWEHPTRGLVGPAEFLPIAEQTGLTNVLTASVLDLALEQCRQWRAVGSEMLVSINLSLRNLLDTQLCEMFVERIGKHRLPSGAIQVEISESAAAADRTVRALEALRSVGVSIAIDNYGTGRSSLAQLKRLPLDEIKIDKSFIAGMTTNNCDAAIVGSTVELARSLDLRVTAEGIESNEVCNELIALGCDFGQGYLPWCTGTG